MLMKTILCGDAPKDLGVVDLNPKEMMAWLYCPIKLAASRRLVLPSNLKQFSPIVEKVRQDISEKKWVASYVYLTAKTLFVTPEAPGNRPGWHADGYMSDDLNYVWADRNPTIFWVPPKPVEFPADHKVSMPLMDEWATQAHQYQVTYPVKTLLRLDEHVLHRVGACDTPGMRTFVKVSVSDKKYLLSGNSVNYNLAPGWTYTERETERNDPLAPLAV
jgi:hypothetical protein